MVGVVSPSLLTWYATDLESLLGDGHRARLAADGCGSTTLHQ
jgi:hypothetical protein